MVTDEIKLDIVVSIIGLFSSSAGLLANFKLLSLHPAAAIGYLITLLVQLASSEKNRDLKFQALNAIDCILAALDRNVVAFFLPGISTALCKV